MPAQSGGSLGPVAPAARPSPARLARSSLRRLLLQPDTFVADAHHKPARSAAATPRPERVTPSGGDAWVSGGWTDTSEWAGFDVGGGDGGGSPAAPPPPPPPRPSSSTWAPRPSAGRGGGRSSRDRRDSTTWADNYSSSFDDDDDDDDRGGGERRASPSFARRSALGRGSTPRRAAASDSDGAGWSGRQRYAPADDATLDWDGDEGGGGTATAAGAARGGRDGRGRDDDWPSPSFSSDRGDRFRPGGGRGGGGDGRRWSDSSTTAHHHRRHRHRPAAFDDRSSSLPDRSAGRVLTTDQIRGNPRLPSLAEYDAADRQPGWWVEHLARLGCFNGRPGAAAALDRPGALAWRRGDPLPHPDVGAGPAADRLVVGGPGDDTEDGEEEAVEEAGGGGDAAASAAASEAAAAAEPPLQAAAALAFSILSATNDWRAPLGIARDCGALFDAVCAACAVHRVAKNSLAASPRPHPRDVLHHPDWAGALEPLAAALIPSFTPRQVSNVWWALSKLKARRSRLLPLLVARVASFTPSERAAWRPQELGNTLWAAATLGMGEPGPWQVRTPDGRPAWADVWDEVRARDPMDFQTQGLSNLVYAAVLLGIQDDAFMAGVAAATIARIDYCSPQSVSNTAWAFNDANYYHSAAYDAAAAHVAARTPEYKPQELCNVLYALAKMEHVDARAFAAVDADVGRPERWGGAHAPAPAGSDDDDAGGPSPRAFAPGWANQAIANLAYSFARAGWYAAAALPRLAAAALARMPRFEEQEISNVIWAFGRLGYDPGPAFLAAFSDRVLVLLKRAEEADAEARRRPGAQRPAPARVHRWAVGLAAQAGRGVHGSRAGRAGGRARARARAPIRARAPPGAAGRPDRVGRERRGWRGVGRAGGAGRCRERSRQPRAGRGCGGGVGGRGGGGWRADGRRRRARRARGRAAGAAGERRTGRALQGAWAAQERKKGGGRGPPVGRRV